MNIEKRQQEIDIYDIWIDGSGICHSICEMETSYINRCVNQINKCADNWRKDTFEELSPKDKKDILVPLQKAWFVVNSLGYLKSFKHILGERLEDTSHIDKLIDRITIARNDR